MSPFPTLWVCHCDSVRQPFPLHPTKGPGAFLVLTRSSQVAAITHTHTEGDFRPASGNDSHITTQMASSVGGGFSNKRLLNVNGASPEAFRGLFEDHFRFIAADA